MPEMMIPDISVEEKEQLKLERLQSTLNRAYKNVPFHRNRFLENNLSPQDIVSLGDLARLPFMNRAHLGTHYPYGLFAVPLRDIVRIHTAPGTGTSPSISGYTKADLLI
ncbi:MAG: phenylacetate--CoA ligase family protein, partial [Desulfobacterales bacterium]|nr:phenylacetate--CoA ligase family protein [Desulfobacterales bacterium]